MKDAHDHLNINEAQWQAMVADFRTAEFPSADAVRARWSEVESEQRSFLEAVTAERLLTVLRYVNLQGQTWQYPLWRQMVHVVNHSTYHRGQLATMLRQLGARPIPTDLLVFDDEGEPSPA
jgi:uncharacterized damage-inducible protein DinB